MRIAFVTEEVPENVSAWSGIIHYVAKALADPSVEIDPIGPLVPKYEALFKVKEGAYRSFLRRRHPRSREPFIAKHYARQVMERLRPDHDLVFAIGTLPLPYLECAQPVVAWTDATFASLVDFYPYLSNLSAGSRRQGNALESAGLKRCRLVIYSSDWAAASAINDYGVDPERVAVVPFGANLNTTLSDGDAEAALRERRNKTCRLLFLGVEWERKGGALAVEIASSLNAAGLRTELDIVGPGPPRWNPPPFVNLHGFVDKSSEEGRATLGRLLARSHFLLLPTRADCSPIVLNEAAAYALPVLTTSVGGIPSIVRDERNGKLFTLEAGAEEYSSYVLDVLSDWDRYREFALSSLAQYRMRLNWDVAGTEVRRLLLGVTSSR